MFRSAAPRFFRSLIEFDLAGIKGDIQQARNIFTNLKFKSFG